MKANPWFAQVPESMLIILTGKITTEHPENVETISDSLEPMMVALAQ